MSSAKLKRKHYSVRQKFQILQELKTNKHKDVSKKHGIASSTLSTFLKDRNKIFSLYKKSQVNDGKKARKNYPEVDNAVHLWYKDKVKKCIKVSESDLKKKAVEIALVVGIDDFECSNHWVDRFQKQFKVEKDRNGFLYEGNEEETEIVDDSSNEELVEDDLNEVIVDSDINDGIVESDGLNEDNTETSCEKIKLKNTANLQPITFINVDEIEECVDVDSSKVSRITNSFYWMPEKADDDSDDDLLLGFETHPSLLMPPDDDVSDTENNFLGFGTCEGRIVKKSTYIIKTEKKEEPVKIEENEQVLKDMKARVGCTSPNKAVLNIVPIKQDNTVVKSDGICTQEDPLMQSQNDNVKKRIIIQDTKTMQTIEPVTASPAELSGYQKYVSCIKDEVSEPNSWTIPNQSVMSNDALGVCGTNATTGIPGEETREEVYTQNSWPNPSLGNNMTSFYITNEVIEPEIPPQNNLPISNSSFMNNLYITDDGKQENMSSQNTWSVSNPVFINNGVPTSYISNEALVKNVSSQNSWPLPNNSFGNNSSMNSFITNEVVEGKGPVKNSSIMKYGSSYIVKEGTDQEVYNENCLQILDPTFLNNGVSSLHIANEVGHEKPIENCWTISNSSIVNDVTNPCQTKESTLYIPPIYEKFLDAMENIPCNSSDLMNPSSGVINTSSLDIMNPSVGTTNVFSDNDNSEPFTIYPIDPNLIKRETCETVTNFKRNDIIRFAVESMFKKSSSNSPRETCETVTNIKRNDIIRFAVESMFKKSSSNSPPKDKRNEVIDLTSDNETNESSESKVSMLKSGSSKPAAEHISKKRPHLQPVISQHVEIINCSNLSASTTISAISKQCSRPTKGQPIVKTSSSKYLGKSNVSISLINPHPNVESEHSVTNTSDIQKLDFDDNICEIKPQLPVLDNQNRKVTNYQALDNKLKSYKNDAASNIMSPSDTKYKRLTSKFFENKLAQRSKTTNVKSQHVSDVQNKNLLIASHSQECNVEKSCTTNSLCPVSEGDTLNGNRASEFVDICENNSTGELTAAALMSEGDSYQQPRIVSVVSLSSIGENTDDNLWTQKEEETNDGSENFQTSLQSSDSQANNTDYFMPHIVSVSSLGSLKSTRKCYKKNFTKSIHSNNQSPLMFSPNQAGEDNSPALSPTHTKFNDSSTRIEQINMKQNIDYKKKRTGAVDKNPVIKKLDMQPINASTKRAQNQSVLKKHFTFFTLPSENRTVASVSKAENIKFVPISLMASSSTVTQSNNFNLVNQRLQSPKADKQPIVPHGNVMPNVQNLSHKQNSTKRNIMPVRYNKHTSLLSSINAALKNADSVVFLPLSKVLDNKEM